MDENIRTSRTRQYDSASESESFADSEQAAQQSGDARYGSDFDTETGSDYDYDSDYDFSDAVYDAAGPEAEAAADIARADMQARRVRRGRRKFLTGLTLVLAGALAGVLLSRGGGIHINIASFNGSDNTDGYRD